MTVGSVQVEDGNDGIAVGNELGKAEGEVGVYVGEVEGEVGELEGFTVGAVGR